MRKTSIYFGLFITSLYACQNAPKQADSQTEPAVVQDHTQTHEHEHEEKANQVLLNNGEKWPANTETTEGIRKMSALLKALPAEPKLEDYHALQTKLNDAFSTIVQKCTMEGEAHNQLHNFILPIKDMIKDLDSQDVAECKAVADKLKKHLDEYGNYFQ